MAFPGAAVTCACGARIDVPGVAPTRASSAAATPYRAPPSAPLSLVEERVTMCPFCGNGCPPLVRICPHCDVRLDNVRCARCFSLQKPGAFTCARCGDALELETLFDATDAPCPSCTTPLEASASNDTRTHECPRCGGIFVSRDALAEILCKAEIGGPLSAPPPRAAAMLDVVRYRPCPLCHATMNRQNFGKVSGVIVDVCTAHGTWFDGGELTRIVAFVASGGLEKTRARDAAERSDAANRRGARAELPAFDARTDGDVRLDSWRDLLATLLRFG